MLVIGAVLAARQIGLGLFFLRRKKDPRSIAGLALHYIILIAGYSSLTFKMGSGWGRLGLYSHGPHEMHTPPPHTHTTHTTSKSLASLHQFLPTLT